MGMSVFRANANWVAHVLLFLIVFVGLVPCVHCVEGDDYSKTGDPALLPAVTQVIYGRLSNLTKILTQDIVNNLGFCIKDVNTDWNGAFNYAGKLDFLTNCIKKTKGDVTQRLCTAAEIKFYFSSLFERGAADDNYLKPNKNCNLTSWASGCEPGWGCTVGQDQRVDLKTSNSMPSRTHDCQPCCEGFFCPQGITCMIPCPLGSYCPLAKFNKTTGICDLYSYQMPPGKPNHTCGGADIWADVEGRSEIFCSPGSYCPTTTQKVPCRSG